MSAKSMPTPKAEGLRHNKGKLRYDLLHPVALEGITKVMTAGAEKYAERNWEAGMDWTTVLASLKRHIALFEAGEDFDEETGLLHMDHAQCNTHFLSAYYKIAPHYDNRPHNYLSDAKIGLDIDEVLCDWIGGWMERYDIEDVPEWWFFDRKINVRFDDLRKKGELEEFYLNLKPLIDPKDIPFNPHCYITSRPCSTETTEKWLDMHGFPTKKVYTIPPDKSKVDVAKESGIDFFVDDRFENFRQLTSAGIFTYLMDHPHNRRHNVGFRRIKSLEELKHL